MGSTYEVEVTISSAKDLKNVNWRYGPINPYVVAWVDPDRKVSTRVDEEGDTSPRWDQTLVIPLDHRPIQDAVLRIDVVHAHAESDTKPLIGSAKLPLQEVVDEAGIGSRFSRALKLKRPSGRPQGKVEVEVSLRDPRHESHDRYQTQPYGVTQNTAANYPYSQPAYSESSYAQPGYAQPGYAQPGYAQPGYGQPGYAQAGYGQPGYGYEYGKKEKKESKSGGMGMGTGLAIGAVGGVLGGLALAEGVEALEDHVADEAAERVEDDLADGGFDGGDDW